MKKLTSKNILKAITQPGKALKYLKLNQKSKAFDEGLTTKYFGDAAIYEGYKKEILSSGLIEELEAKLVAQQKELQGEVRGIELGTGAMNIYQGIKLYAILRHLKPDVVVETGVCNGASTSYILKALDKNGKGKLYSIDFPEIMGADNKEIWEGKGSSVLTQDKSSGWMVPQDLQGRWDLRLGKSQEVLPPLVEELNEIDFFIHDSEHSYRCMKFEFDAAYPHIREGGILASHDIDMNTAFQDFAKAQNKEWIPVDDYMGFFVR